MYSYHTFPIDTTDCSLSSISEKIQEEIENRTKELTKNRKNRVVDIKLYPVTAQYSIPMETVNPDTQRRSVMLIDNLDLRPVEKKEEPSLALLAYKLRHPEEWPEGFEFDYCSQWTCAMGLACAMWWPKTGSMIKNNISQKFGIPMEVVLNLFFKVGSHMSLEKRGGGVTNEECALVIERYLSGTLLLLE